MDFDKSRVYTAVNADELKAGSKVIVAYELSNLREQVQGNIEPMELLAVLGDDYFARFKVVDNNDFALAYLVSEPEEKKLKWTDLKIGDVIRCKDGSRESMVTTIDTVVDEDVAERELHILAGVWLSNKELEGWEKVEYDD